MELTRIIRLSFNFQQCKYLTNKCFDQCNARNKAWKMWQKTGLERCQFMGTVRQGERASGNITNRTIYAMVWYTLYDQTWECGLLFYCRKSTLSQPAKRYSLLRNTSHVSSIVCRPTVLFVFIWLCTVALLVGHPTGGFKSWLGTTLLGKEGWSVWLGK